MPNNDYDDLFDQWGQALNVDPQLAKSVFQQESSGNPTADSGGGMGLSPDVASKVAVRMGFDPKAVNIKDMRWAVPIGMQILADGMNQTQSAEGALGYYNTGSTDPKRWNQGYIDKVTKLYPDMALTPAGQQSSQDQQPSGNDIVATGSKLIGQSSATINPFLRQNGQSLDATRANWCAAFVNGVLDANGVQGTTGPSKNVATSFMNWGEPAQSDPQPGDVLVLPRGHPAGGLGGHVGIATGHVADGSNGQSFYLMESGNLNGKVAYSWEPANSVMVRRAPSPTPDQQQQQQQAAVQ